MRKSETDDEAEDARLRWDGRGGRLAMLGKKNLTRDGPMIHAEAEIERRNVSRATEKKERAGHLPCDKRLARKPCLKRTTACLFSEACLPLQALKAASRKPFSPLVA